MVWQYMLSEQYDRPFVLQYTLAEQYDFRSRCNIYWLNSMNYQIRVNVCYSDNIIGHFMSSISW